MSYAQAASPAKVAHTSLGKTLVDANGMTLYTFAKDTKPGDVTGDGFLNGAWHAAKP